MVSSDNVLIVKTKIKLLINMNFDQSNIFVKTGSIRKKYVETKVEWPSTGYKQITPDHYDFLPYITEAHVEGNFKQILDVDNLF